MTSALIASFFLLAQPGGSSDAVVGPKSGALVVVGGGALRPEIIEAFVSLAGGPDSPIVLIPTAAENDPVDVQGRGDAFAKEFGLTHVTVLHTRDRAQADSEAFVAP